LPRLQQPRQHNSRDARTPLGAPASVLRLRALQEPDRFPHGGIPLFGLGSDPLRRFGPQKSSSYQRRPRGNQCLTSRQKIHKSLPISFSISVSDASRKTSLSFD